MFLKIEKDPLTGEDIKIFDVDDYKHSTVSNEKNFNKKIREDDKKKQFKRYDDSYNSLINDEIKRLKQRSNYTRVTEFDCGPCARCRVKNCDGWDCKKRGKNGNFKELKE